MLIGRKSKGRCNLWQLRKQISRLIDGTSPLLPSLYPHHSDIPPFPPRKALPRKTGINSLACKNSNLCESIHEFQKQSLKSDNCSLWIAFLTRWRKGLHSSSWETLLSGVSGSFRGRRGPDGCSCCDVKMTLAAWMGRPSSSSSGSAAGMGMGLLLLLLLRRA